MPTAIHEMWVRRLLALDLGLFNLALILFALLPPTDIRPQEWIAIAGAAMALIGVVSQAIQHVRIPCERWAYLVTAMAGLWVFFAYAHFAQAPSHVKVPYLIFLASGIASAAAAHIIIGGPTIRADG